MQLLKARKRGLDSPSSLSSCLELPCHKLPCLLLSTSHSSLLSAWNSLTSRERINSPECIQFCLNVYSLERLTKARVLYSSYSLAFCSLANLCSLSIEAFISTCRCSMGNCLVLGYWLLFFYATAGVICGRLSIKDSSNIILLYKHHCCCHRGDSHLLLGIKDGQEGVQKSIMRTYNPNNLNSLCKAKRIERQQINVSHSRWAEMMWILSCSWNFHL